MYAAIFVDEQFRIRCYSKTESSIFRKCFKNYVFFYISTVNEI